MNDPISISRQCELPGLARSILYYQIIKTDPYNLLLMRLLDEQFFETAFYGTRRMAACLKRQGHNVNRKYLIQIREYNLPAVIL